MGLRKYILLFASLLFLSVLDAYADRNEVAESDALLVEAVAKINAGKYDEAMPLLGKAEKLNPRNDAVQYYKGYVAVAKGKVQPALTAFENACRLDSTNIWYKRRLAGIYSATGKNALAEKVLKSILSSLPYDLEAIANLMDVSISQGKVAQADSLLAIIEKVQGPSEYTCLARLEMYHSARQYDRFFDTLKSYVSGDGISSQNRSRILKKLLSSFTPSFTRDHLKDWSDVMDTGIAAHPSDTSFLHFAGTFFYSADCEEKISQMYRNNQDDDFIVTLEIYSAFRHKRYKSALSCCDRLSLLRGDSITDEEKLFIHSTKGDCYQQLGKQSSAFSEYEAALKVDPENAMVLNNYAYYMACLGKNLKKCEQMSRRTIEKESGNPTYLDTYAWILYKMKKYDEAKSYMKKAIGHGGKDHSEILLHYAAILDALGEKTLARSYRQLAKQKD